ncbi:hypothetical protein GHI93_12145 [Lactococcus hircilactis]|uniref:RamC N-terminal domain-containing protein n=1 Tax=Lactococcus hircilactis TaxID=1494462 RepID=A0A7X1ZC26_9LACT|nr:hypothetical protein [Lactococcus hircilactis]MQW40666.1 hypothetical protein [Lactococcus hircilactis]
MEKFTYFTTDRYKLPKYGFKIHVSATVESYEKVFDLTKRYLLKQKLYNFYTKSYEEGFLKGYEGYKFIKELRRKL